MDAATDRIPAVEEPALTLPTPRDEGASQDDTGHPPERHLDVASEPVPANLPTPRQTTDAGATDSEPVVTAVPIEATTVGLPSATAEAAQDEISAPPPTVAVELAPDFITSPRAADPSNAEGAVLVLPTSAREDDSVTKSDTQDAMPSARPLEVPVLALPEPVARAGDDHSTFITSKQLACHLATASARIIKDTRITDHQQGRQGRRRRR